ncbi:MAG: hypothetical protein R3C68_01015 [Myxococcota bacterium]
MSDNFKSLAFIDTLNPRAVAAPLPDLEIQHTWFRAVKLAKWTTVALVPADEDVSVLPIARGLGQMATQEPGARVLVVNARTLECKQTSDKDSSDAAVQTDPEYGYDMMDFSTLALRKAQQALALLPELLERVTGSSDPYSTVIIAVDPVLGHTRALPAVKAADCTVLCLPLGRTTFVQARHLVELIGREKILGSIAIK